MKTLARWLSIVLHPFVMVGVMVGSAAAALATLRLYVALIQPQAFMVRGTALGTAIGGAAGAALPYL